jgi:hypothetical protein
MGSSLPSVHQVRQRISSYWVRIILNCFFFVWLYPLNGITLVGGLTVGLLSHFANPQRPNLLHATLLVSVGGCPERLRALSRKSLGPMLAPPILGLGCPKEAQDV